MTYEISWSHPNEFAPPSMPADCQLIERAVAQEHQKTKRLEIELTAYSATYTCEEVCSSIIFNIDFLLAAIVSSELVSHWKWHKYISSNEISQRRIDVLLYPAVKQLM